MDGNDGRWFSLIDNVQPGADKHCSQISNLGGDRGGFCVEASRQQASKLLLWHDTVVFGVYHYIMPFHQSEI